MSHLFGCMKKKMRMYSTMPCTVDVCLFVGSGQRPLPSLLQPPAATMCDNGGTSLQAEFGTNLLFQKNTGDWIQKYVVKEHGFPFLKWCDTSQSVQRFGCYSSLKWVAKIWWVFWREGGEDTSVLLKQIKKWQIHYILFHFVNWLRWGGVS